MTTERLDIRLDQDRRRKLQVLAEEEGTRVSEIVRRLIDRAYDEKLKARRRRAVLELIQMEVEDVPDPEILNQQLEATYEPGGID